MGSILWDAPMLGARWIGTSCLPVHAACNRPPQLTFSAGWYLQDHVAHANMLGVAGCYCCCANAGELSGACLCRPLLVRDGLVYAAADRPGEILCLDPLPYAKQTEFQGTTIVSATCMGVTASCSGVLQNSSVMRSSKLGLQIAISVHGSNSSDWFRTACRVSRI